MSEIPKTTFLLSRSNEDWNYEVEPSKNACFGLDGQKCTWPRGKGLGGSGLINGMLYIRGHRKDFDTWAEDGNVGWDYDSVLQHFRKFEDVQGVEDESYGKGGELKLTRYQSRQPIRNALIDAYKQFGYGEYTDEKPMGYLDTYVNIWEGTRFTAAEAFLPKTKNRNNFYVALNAQVSRILVNDDLTATGIEVRINNKILKLKSLKEVVLSAGSTNSPQILMNSGIGPEDHLSEIGIPVLKNLKVGHNLRDHIIFSGLFFEINDEALIPQTANDMIDSIYHYFQHRKGRLAQSGVENFQFFFNTRNQSEYPNAQLYYGGLYKNQQLSIQVLKQQMNMPDELLQSLSEINKRTNVMILIPSISQPKSFGKILLRSSDPFDKPKILANYLSDENGEDLQTLMEGIRFYQKLLKTKAFSRYKPNMVRVDIPNCRRHEMDSDEYWTCAVRNIATTVYHPTGTCKMGPTSDPEAVVDPRLRIHGMKRIRVIDASIIPKMHHCNTNAAAIMIGEKGAAMIREDWNEKRTEL
ncbi:hypothetical protein RI129_012606 [Pyrocoelia pectoralis]|uniref:Glucose-methanol-choline oxidoreductase N-terminal domain-containing protein n=1 Tax=Pyrocoelia pectoralis TaxID=417401 RepID=A0AAN7V443_9COLE